MERLQSFKINEILPYSRASFPDMAGIRAFHHGLFILELIASKNIMKNPIFKNKNGDISVYSLACGYIQEKQTRKGNVELYKDGNFHVRIFNGTERISWECFDSLTEARKAFRLA